MTSRERADSTLPPWHRDAALWSIVVIAAVVRLAAIAEPMRFDEAVTYVEFVRKPWSTVVSSYPYPNNHVFFSLLAKLSSALAPMQPWAIRLPALLAGLAIVPLTYAVGRAFFGRSEGLVGSALSAVTTPLVLYSVNARGYSLVAALFLVELLLVQRLRTQSSSGSRGWVALAATAALGAYTIPVMLYPHGILGVWLALDFLRTRSAASRDSLVRFTAASVAAAAVAGLLYLPILREEGLAALVGNKFVVPQSWGSFAIQMPRSLLATVLQWTMPLPLWSAPIPFALAVAGVARSRRLRAEAPSLALACVLWCGVLLATTHRVPFMRIWIFLLPLYCLAVAGGLLALGERIARGAHRLVPRAVVFAPVLAALIGVVSLATGAVAGTTETGAFPDAPVVTAALKSRLRDGDRVLAPIPTNGPLLFYFVVEQVETGYLSTREESMRRAFIVLDTTRGQSLEWAVRQGMIDPRRFARPRLVGRFGAAELWVSDKL